MRKTQHSNLSDSNQYWSVPSDTTIKKGGRSSSGTTNCCDSDSEESSSGSFVALPEEFRPNLSPQGRQKYSDTSYSAKHTQCSHTASNVRSNKANFEDPCRENYRSLTGQKQQSLCRNEAKPNAGLKRFQVEDEGYRIDAPTTQYKHTASTNTKHRGMNSATATDKNINIQARMNTAPADLNARKNAKIGGRTVPPQETHNKPVITRQEHAVFVSKPSRNRERGMQHVEQSDPGTIRISFELPLSNPLPKDKLEYKAKFLSEAELPKAETLKNENEESSPTYRIKREHSKDQISESAVQWKDELCHQQKQNNYCKSKIQWEATEGKTANGSAGYKQNKSKQSYNNSNKWRQAQEVKKPFREKSQQRHFNNSFQAENIRQETAENVTKLKEPKTCLQEKIYSEVISFYRNNFDEDTLNHAGTRIPDKNMPCSNANKESSMQTMVKIKNVPLAQNLQEKKQTYKMDEPYHRPPDNLEHTKMEIIEEKKDDKFDSKSNNFNDIKVNGIQEKDIVYYGKEMSDLIVGSHDALSMFIAFHKEWIISRRKLIDFFEGLEKKLSESSKKFTKYQDIVSYAKHGLQIASLIPYPPLSIATKIVSLFTTFFSSILQNQQKNAEIDNNDEIASLLFKDTQASTELYMYGLQCNQQFEETVKMIEEFHSKVMKYEIFPPREEREIAIFVRGVLEYKPTHRTFYRKLHKCFQELLQTVASSDCRRFCEPLLLHTSTAVDVIGHLNWRFRLEDFSNESVKHELDHIHGMIMDDSNTSVKDLIASVQNCLRIMKDELDFVEKCLKDVSLFDAVLENSIKKK